MGILIRGTPVINFMRECGKTIRQRLDSKKWEGKLNIPDMKRAEPDLRPPLTPPVGGGYAKKPGRRAT